MTILGIILIVLFIFAILGVYIFYLCDFWDNTRYDEVETKREFILCWTIPFYMWKDDFKEVTKKWKKYYGGLK